ncbi:hypothetical protein BAnh1_02350 [Bartonella australis AUST/NH1]|uniref:Uncharacterized protein n=1 Tax=Bartonella australis (strain Aust/NH1) TaxID=1094489 RepID=M1NXC3_BARAA|nr:RusA family crossover junction endodeoxyribonuclease [Bartonella australis]AGF74122.1 hypothetical protein BAnh1_02350 [Bartonella australis AUST/NH1]
MIRLELPFPPSVNAMYANGGNKRGRHKTARYKAWMTEAGYRIKDSHRQGLREYSLSVAVKRPDKRCRDIDNLVKPINDLLQGSGIIKNDSHCEQLTLSWDSALNCECLVCVEPFQLTSREDDHHGKRCQ